MNVLNKIMSYDKTKYTNQENCNCEECVSVENVESDNQITEYPKLSDEEIEQIISERYSDKNEKTKTFIRKALRKHGDRYDYSNVIYVKGHEKVEIICRVKGHEPFPQTPSAHKQGQGCPICGGSKKLTLKEFIEKANKKHGVGRYDYSKVKYINSDTDVIIICHNHEEPYEFPQKPSNHLQGQGCRLCGIKKCIESRKLTLEEFIKISNEVHGEGTYNYSKVVYITNDTDVIIICPKHGEFPQTPSNHMRGSGCSKCKFEKLAELYKLTTEEFIERANFVHGIGTYDYSKVNYVNMHTEVIITCPKHGDFPEEPASHLQGCGCRFCAIEKRADMLRMTLEEFIECSNEVHGIGTYDYSKVNYTNNHTEVIITCPIHGDFPQTPSNHLKGQGCSFCKGGVRLTTEEFIKRANKIHGKGTFDYSEVNYVDAQTEVIIICPIHGGFPQTPNSHLNGSGCSKCNNNKGENAIRNFLTTQGIEFEEQKSFENCKYKKSLRFDFYIPQYNLCIESDGNIHSEKINWSGKMTNEEMEENLKLNQLRDQIKNDYCKNNGINLLRVNNLKAVEELTEYFQNNGIIK